ncbi:DUF4845 domain-containing protein [Hydrocarboniclastica marina]|nr:DUF4845 domain-containing protein [Hydrocarboniclastica marina]
MRVQTGASTLATLLVLLSAALLLVAAVKIIPIYVDDYTVQEMMESLSNDEETRTLSMRELKDRIQRRMGVNSVKVIKATDIKLEQEGQTMKMTVNYEVRTNLFANIDALVHFDHSYEWNTQ